MLKFLGEMHLEEYKLSFLTFFIDQVIVNGHISNCRSSLEKFWVPTLREDADLTACISYLRDPAGLPPASVCLLQRSVCIHAPMNPSEDSRGALAADLLGTNAECKPKPGLGNLSAQDSSYEVQESTGDLNSIAATADKEAHICNECGQLSCFGDFDE